MIVRVLIRAIEAIVTVAMAVVSVVVIAEVLLRYLLGQSLVVTEELSRYLMVWIAFLGSVLLIREHGHVAAEGLTTWLGPRSRRVLDVVAQLLTVAFLVTLALAGIQTLPGQRDQALTTIDITIFWFYLAIPVGAGLMALIAMARLLGLDDAAGRQPSSPLEL
jgi:TRAP-type transport system small permease protein